MIEAITIAKNRYAPDGAQDICVFRMDGGEKLTLGQLMAAICIKAGASLEAQSISMVNKLNSGNVLLDKTGEYMEKLGQGAINDDEWKAMKNTCINELGVTDELPDHAQSYNDRVKAMAALKKRVEELSRKAQKDMIEVQSLLSKRDVALTTSTNLVAAIGMTMDNTARNY